MVVIRAVATCGFVVWTMLIGTGCRSWNPMSFDFRGAVHDETEGPITDGQLTNDSMARFLTTWGAAAVPYLVEVLADEQCEQEGSGLRRAWTAVRALRVLRDKRAQPGLEGARDSQCVNVTLRWQVLRALAELDGRPTAPIAVEELAVERENHDAHLVVEILSSGDASIAPKLAAIADTEKDPRDRALYRFLSIVMTTPSQCRLNPYGSVPDGSEYLCQYTCPAPATYHQEHQASACTQSVPVPGREVAWSLRQ